MELKEIDPYGIIDFTEWQNILDILSNISGAKSAAITKIDLPYIQALKISASPELPLYEGMCAELVNHYCEEVFNSQEKVLVTNALKQERWKNAPEIKQGLVSYLGYPLFLPDGEIFGTLCIHNDQETNYSQEIYNLMHQFKKVVEAHFAMAAQTKQLKESEEALRSSETRFRKLIENSPDAIFVQTQGRFAYLNSAALDLFGAKKEADLLGKPVMDRFHPEFHAQVQERIHRLNSEKKQVPRLEEVYLKLDGTPIEVEVSAVPIQYEEHDGALVFARDISERKQLEQLKEDIEKITRHDLKAPLNGILSLPQALLSDENLTEEQKEILQYIQSSGQRMLDMVNMSMSLYQMEKGEYEFSPKSLDLVPVIKDIENDLNSLFKNKYSKLVLEIITEKDNKHVFFVSAERLLCYTMLSNLIKNAVESIEYGEVVYVCVEETQSSQAKICIHNPGIIPEEIQKSFGQKYSTLGKISGTGLGVYSARLIANTMNGVFDWSTSREDGTYVYLYLPRPEET